MYQVVQEKTGEDLRVIHTSQLKACFPTAQQLDEIQHRQLVELFKEEDNDEELLGIYIQFFRRGRECDKLVAVT